MTRVLGGRRLDQANVPLIPAHIVVHEKQFGIEKWDSFRRDQGRGHVASLAVEKVKSGASFFRV